MNDNVSCGMCGVAPELQYVQSDTRNIRTRGGHMFLILAGRLARYLASGRLLYPSAVTNP